MPLSSDIIVENYPELADLDSEQKLILAGELWKSATSPDTDSPDLSLEVVQMLEERLAHFEENPDTGVKVTIPGMVKQQSNGDYLDKLRCRGLPACRDESTSQICRSPQ